MKLIAILTLFLSQYALTAQTYLNSSSVWTESIGICGFTGSCDIYDFTRSISGDTVINGLSYQRVITSGTHSVYDLDSQAIVLVEPYTGETEFIREEDQLLYWYRVHNDSEIILADFDLAVGDTAVSRLCQNNVTVDHIDTLYLGSEPRRRYWFQPGNDNHNFLIEGVGANGGLFTNPCSEIGFEYGSSLHCFAQDGAMIVIDTAECEAATAVDNPVSYKSLFVYPNPCYDELQVQLPDGLTGSLTLEIFNSTGQLVNASMLQSDGEGKVNMKGFSAGVYYVRIMSMEGVFLGSVVKR
jgi:hypothetical protein